ncbi:PTS sugar transporter subunit IIA [Geobacter argillaceus]|uniref:Phosphotransferase IIA-like nitrogen-regulatory protein PtsN n=1 Tax=Geobacter argillaceus TaxID=345631 RepID=A0A562WR20_9BACT|nr:PTS sugar transporter subunit IIA [Geobacter argillaceus]TWJ32571.1 phosphotransferase IIA-like nitrogen-regulatory protein PtsN [Geobacter argillaceus]
MLTDDLQPAAIIPVLSARNKEDVLAELAQNVIDRHPALDRQDLLQILNEREKLGSTGIGDGIAIPHGKLRQVNELICAFGRSPEGVDFSSLDGRPVHLFFLLVAPENAAAVHLKALARISRILRDPAVRNALMAADDVRELFRIFQEQDNRF